MKYRKKVLNKHSLLITYKVFSQVCKEMGYELVAFGAEANHVHLLVSLSPKVPIYELVVRLKGAPSLSIEKIFYCGLGLESSSKSKG